MGWNYHNKPHLGWPVDGDHSLADFEALWLFNESSGNLVNDLSGNRYTGTFVNDTHFVPGMTGPALDFDGTGDRVDFPAEVIGAGAVTIAALICPRNAGGGNTGRIVDSGNEIFYMNPNRVVFSSDGGVTNKLSAVGSIPYNTWSYVVVVRNSDGTVTNIYVNGVVSDAPANSGTPSTGGTLRLGDRPAGARGFDGLMDHAIIWNRELILPEIEEVSRVHFCMFKDPDEIPLLDQYYSVAAGGIEVLRRRMEAA